jgi:transposase
LVLQMPEAQLPSYVGLDYSLRTTSVCVLDERGRRVQEGSVDSTPEAVVGFLQAEPCRYDVVGLEASSPSWFSSALSRMGLITIRIDPQHARGVLKARANKTDKNDAHGIAELMRVGAYKAVHDKTDESRRLGFLLAAHRLLKRKQTDLETGLRSALRDHGLDLGRGRRKTFNERARSLAAGAPDIFAFVERVLAAHISLAEGAAELERQIEIAARKDATCRRLMTAPGVGPISAVTYRVTIDDPHRFRRSRDVAAYLGLTPRIHQSGQMLRRGRISKHGNVEVRRHLFMGARSLMRPGARPSPLKAWGNQIAQRRGKKTAFVAVARRLAVLLHRMWITETDFIWASQENPTITPQ